ncbi:MAG: acyltransferase [Bacteroidetes bacterium]|nr:acyltransferase [Bacteroidota bacterium]
MNKKTELKDQSELLKHFEELNALNIFLESRHKENYDRSLPLPDHINDRWERAERLGFGKGTNIYDSSYVIGNVKVGENCWIGMFTILDGSGDLSIGNNCTISAGVHMYTHDNLKATLSSNVTPIERAPVTIGNNCYIAPHSVISKGVTLGDFTVVAAHSFVNKSFAANAIVAGIPAKQIGKVTIDNNNNISFDYFK